MEQENGPIQWTEDQWSLVQQTVRDEARKVRVAASFLPIHGPLPPETESVQINRLVNNQPLLQAVGIATNRLAVNTARTRALTTVSVNVPLTTAQAKDPDLSGALNMFRRAALILARIQDNLVFQGQRTVIRARTFAPMPPVFNVTGGEQWNGLTQAARLDNTPPHFTRIPSSAVGLTGNWLVRQVSNLITNLEREGHLSPCALVLGPDLFDLAHTPTSSLVMPVDRIKPLLNGPLLRSSTLTNMEGVLVSLAGENVDLVLANDVSVKFLQSTEETRHVYRVSQRLTLRVKQPEALWHMSS
jgi:uncharacterized linocin/CFP29 family protein